MASQIHDTHNDLPPTIPLIVPSSRLSFDNAPEADDNDTKPPNQPQDSSHFLSPTVIPSPVQKHPRPLNLSDIVAGPDGLESLGPEIASADIIVAADGSFIETSSNQAAIELKRKFDQLAGVGPDLRTPYAITAFISQHGQQMFRVGHRAEHSAPAAKAVAPDVVGDGVTHQTSTKMFADNSQSPRTRRRSRLSMHFQLPAFTKSNNTSNSATTPSGSGAPLGARPPTATSTTTTSSRKLRKTRSIPDMYGTGVGTGAPEAVIVPGPTIPSLAGRGHSSSLTAQDHTTPSNIQPRPSIVSMMPYKYLPMPQPQKKVDIFADVIDWIPGSHGSGNQMASGTTNVFVAPGPGKVLIQPARNDANGGNGNRARVRPMVGQPFGPGVVYSTPTQRIPSGSIASSSSSSSASSSSASSSGGRDPYLPTPRHLREMQSFESGLTARQGSRTPDLADGDGEDYGVMNGSRIVGEDDSPIPSERSISRPPSAIRLSIASSALLSTTDPDELSSSSSSGQDSPTPRLGSTKEVKQPNFTLSPESLRLSSHYSTEVFNVLQTYRGLPTFEVLVGGTVNGSGGTVGRSRGGSGSGIWDDDSQTQTIRLSLAADQSATPRDDPRFVIWGERVGGGDGGDWDDRSVSRDSLTDSSAGAGAGMGANNASTGGGPGASSLGKRRNSRVPTLKRPSEGGPGSMGVGGVGGRSGAHMAPPMSSHPSSGSSSALSGGGNGTLLPRPIASDPGPNGPSRIILAATIERWIAQLTSDLNYDELLIFCLTYRTYVSSVDLCHLLICRFHWALQEPKSKQDADVRQVVRVRTFVAIRYWLVTFFTVDFVGNRELRLLIADWLNTLMRDPVLKKHSDGFGIIRRLVKVAKECKQAHIKTVAKPKAQASNTNNSSSTNSRSSDDKEDSRLSHVLGKSFAQAALAKRKAASGYVDDDESDLDFDFLPDDALMVNPDDKPGTELGEGGLHSSGTVTSVNAHLTMGHGMGGSGVSGALMSPGSGISGSAPSSTLPVSSLNLLVRTDYAPGPPSSGEPVMPLNAVPTKGVGGGHHERLIPRALARTMDKVGKWRRGRHQQQQQQQSPRGSNVASATGTGLAGVALGGGPVGVAKASGLGTVSVGGVGVVRPSPLSASCAGVSAFDLDINASQDLLTMEGGVEKYLKMMGPKTTGHQTSRAPLTVVVPQSTSSAAIPPHSAPAKPVINAPSGSSSAGPRSPISPASASSSRSSSLRHPPIPPMPTTPPPLPPVPLGLVDTKQASSSSPPASATIPDTVVEAEEDLVSVEGTEEANVVIVPNEDDPATKNAEAALVTDTLSTLEPETANPPSIPPITSDSTTTDTSAVVPQPVDLETPPHDDDDPTSNGNLSQPPTPRQPNTVPTATSEFISRYPHLHDDRPESWRTSSTESFGEPLTQDGPIAPTFSGPTNHWQFDVVSLDDFSDTSSLPGRDFDDEMGGPGHPPGLRKPPRRLPNRRDFELVRRSQVSSMGIISHESMRDSISSSVRSSITSGRGSQPASPTGSATSGPMPIQRWQMKSLQQTFEEMSNAEGDKGDVEDALRRLEGQINPKVQQEKQEKVDGWVRAMQQRLANGDYDYESSIFSEDEREGFIDEVDDISESSDTADSANASPAVEGYQEDNAATAPIDMHSAPASSAYSSPASASGTGSPPSGNIRDLGDAVPLEILQSRLSPAPLRPSIDTTISSKFVATPNDGPRAHRSFILAGSTEALAHHFAMIDRELFVTIKFEELIVDEWMDVEEINIYDWAQFLKDRARWKAESRHAGKLTSLAAIRARFNLMVNFVISEIVLAPPPERHFLLIKFIRIAWRSYNISNFHTLTAIITALQSPWVARACRKWGWGRVPSVENRMFRDLKQFCSSAEEFKFIRQVVESIQDAKPDSHAPSVISGGDSTSAKGKPAPAERPAYAQACIPFIGIYLAQLLRINQLPALIDPTAPNSLVGIDTETAIFDPPAHPEVFANLQPLPESMHLEPLINVHKQRLIGKVIKSFVASQHIACRIQFEVDKKLFQRCLRLHALNDEYLQRALAMYPD